MRFYLSLLFAFTFGEAVHAQRLAEHKSLKINDKIFLHAHGGKGEHYYTTPFKTAFIEECPNIVKKRNKRLSDRLFTIEASLTINLNGHKITVKLENFRDLLVLDEKGTILEKKKITGATSLYKITNKNNVIAFGVGWNRSSEPDPRVDFSTFRVFLPVVEGGKIVIKQELFNGLSQSHYEGAFSKNAPTILVKARTIGTGAFGLYYGLPDFVILDNNLGFKVIQNYKDLKDFADICQYKHLPIFLWLINKNELEEFKIYMEENIDRFIGDEKDDLVHFSKEKRESCLLAIKQFKGPFSINTLKPVFNQCLTSPFDGPENQAFSMWIEDALTST